MPDGRVIEGVASGDGTIPLPEDFDNSTRAGFLRDFDSLESSLVSARDKAVKALAENYMEEVSKKNRNAEPKEQPK